jgi:GTP-binding protein
MPGCIAIVGRPNVGKSALFNRIAGRRIAIVHDEPGVTRDRVTAEAEWRGHAFTLVDTGGIGLMRGEKAADEMQRAALAQVELAIEAAQVILLVVSVVDGVVPLDREVAARLRRAGKTVIVVANKADRPDLDADADEFLKLALDQVVAVSAIHGRGIDVLMRAACARLPEPTSSPADPAVAGGAVAGAALRLAIVGRPNVGKSSIINALTQAERVIVTPIPGTTRDAVDVPFEVTVGGRRERYVLIDTAGLRKERRIDNSIEFYSAKRTEEAIERCDLVLLVMDAEAGVSEQDKKIADQITASRKACILVVNKWDLYQDAIREARAKVSKPSSRRGSLPPATLAEFAAWVQGQMFFLDYAPVVFTSAKSDFQLDRLLEAVRYVAAQWRQEVPTAILNRTLRDAIERRQPVSVAGHRLKFFYATQVGHSPPFFLLFVNRQDLFSDHYSRFLTGELRRAFGFEGCPIRLVARARPRTERSARRSGSLKSSEAPPQTEDRGPKTAGENLICLPRVLKFKDSRT